MCTISQNRRIEYATYEQLLEHNINPSNRHKTRATKKLLCTKYNFYKRYGWERKNGH